MTKKGAYLRTNWRQTGTTLELDAVGRGITQGSAFGGGGWKLPNGGLIWHKISGVGASVAVHNGVYSIGADSVLASVFGVDGFGGVGYKILPIGIFPQFISATAGGGMSVINMVASITTSDDSTIRFYVNIVSITGDQHASYFSAVWHWTGFIVSSP
jgi:hypothetical protein